MEARLWSSHGEVNKHFRSLLASFRKKTSERRDVEQRKAKEQYLKFIKGSMRIYRSYFQCLVLPLSGTEEVTDAAREMKIECMSRFLNYS